MSIEVIKKIANGKISISRIKKIASSVYGIDLTIEEIIEFTSKNNIPTPQVTSRVPYPDENSIFFEARTFWKKVRRYWGDEKARLLSEKIVAANVNSWRGLYPQLSDYIAPIHERSDIDYDRTDDEYLELEKLYSAEQQKILYLKALEAEFKENPQFSGGAKFPLPTPEYEEFKKAVYEQDCLETCDRSFPSEIDLINYFADFWQQVRANRGEAYFDSLKRDLVGSLGQHDRAVFYKSSEKHFIHFLSHLEGFRAKAPWRIPLYRKATLPMNLNGAIARWGGK